MTMQDGFVTGVPRLLLRTEGACVLLCCFPAYEWSGRSWWLFAVLILVPDASMIGYVVSSKSGTAIYNLAHTLTGPLLLLCIGTMLQSSLAAGIGVIWMAHIGADRLFGFGLKYGRGFGSTHLGPVGKSP